MTYVALGDSAGVGVGVDDPEHGYVGVVARRLTESTGKTLRVMNFSISGAMARDVLDNQVPKLTEIPAPDFVTCVIGGNDVAWKAVFRPADFERDMESIATALPTGSVLGLVANFRHWPHENRVRRANQVIRQAAERHSHAVADIHSPTTTLPLREYLRTFAHDRFHPNEKGHLLWADAVWAQLT
ncbi:hypothetical protein GCM10010915_22260 [Microbacterium faecale]|uniref:SGNH hydrolase-type esterase domain-containing protein n=1 Tax=Microbacterium faecale TaxID=1804630 RepID=A0A916YD86_9MICO|nr:GDSL-type esterase/lipase family protein [Microbacterium faecale]GGD40931.1 hypothetical protein GCM10010915_22260 [Microbacterium faecale]